MSCLLFFLCKDVKEKKKKKTDKKKKSAHVSYIYLYTRTHGHAHTLSCRPHSLLFFLLCMRAPERERLHSKPANAAANAAISPASVHTLTLARNHALIFLAIVQPFYPSKPYHKSLHSCYLSIDRSISISSTQTSGFGVYRSDCFSSRAVPLTPQPGKQKTKWR